MGWNTRARLTTAPFCYLDPNPRSLRPGLLRLPLKERAHAIPVRTEAGRLRVRSLANGNLGRRRMSQRDTEDKAGQGAAEAERAAEPAAPLLPTDARLVLQIGRFTLL